MKTTTNYKDGDSPPSIGPKALKFSGLPVVIHGLFLSVLLMNISSSSGTIYVVSEISNETIVQVNDQPARFIPERYAFYGMQGYLVFADPPTACQPVKPPPNPPNLEYPISWILLARRSPDCHFQLKIENAQLSGYSAIIIHNVGSNDTEVMGVEDPGKLVIYATFVGEYDGLLLKNYTYPKTYFLRIRNEFSVNSYLLPFAIIVGICIIVMLLFMVRLLWQQVVRYFRERRRSRRRKLPASALKKLPIHKWTKGDPYETCAICLDDFVEQEKIRVLPCSHGYHIQCIDHWLTKGRRVCPICKRKVIVADEHFSSSDTETEDENAPLLPSTSSTSQNPSGASTFIQNQISVRVLSPRRLLARNRQNPVNDSDTSSVSSGGSHSAADDQGGALTQSLASTRPSTSAGHGHTNHSQVFAEVHQSTEMLRKKLESQKQKTNIVCSVDLRGDGDCVQGANGLENSAFVPENNNSSETRNDVEANDCIGENVTSDQLVVVVSQSNNNDETNSVDSDHVASA